MRIWVEISFFIASQFIGILYPRRPRRPRHMDLIKYSLEILVHVFAFIKFYNLLRMFDFKCFILSHCRYQLSNPPLLHLSVEEKNSITLDCSRSARNAYQFNSLDFT